MRGKDYGEFKIKFFQAISRKVSKIKGGRGVQKNHVTTIEKCRLTDKVNIDTFEQIKNNKKLKYNYETGEQKNSKQYFTKKTSKK